MAKIVYGEMLAPRELSQQISVPRAKAPVWGQFFGANPRGCGGDGYG